MSTPFNPIEIPPGVVAKATKKMRSSNWAEVNMIRWREGQLQPVGGQAQFVNSAFSIRFLSTASWGVGDTVIHMVANNGTVRPSMSVSETFTGTSVGTVASYIGTTLTLTSPALISGVNGEDLTFSGGNYFFASRCKMVHSWHGLDGISYIAYLCEQNLYIDLGGTLYDVTPLDGIVPPTSLVGGYGDGLYNDSTYGTPRSVPGAISITKIPDAYSLDNFGTILYAMTSSDGRLLRWDPSNGPPGPVTGTFLSGTFTNTSPNITMVTANTGAVKPGMVAYDSVAGTLIGTVLTFVGTALVLTANAAIGGTAINIAFANFSTVQPADAGRGPVPHGRSFVVTPDRFIMIFGSTQDGTTDGGNFRRIAWCDQENPGAWDYLNVTSQAGFFDLEPAAPDHLRALEPRRYRHLDRAEGLRQPFPRSCPTSTISSNWPTERRHGRRSRW